MKIFFSYLYIVFLKMSTISMHIFGNQGNSGLTKITENKNYK